MRPEFEDFGVLYDWHEQSDADEVDDDSSSSWKDDDEGEPDEDNALAADLEDHPEEWTLLDPVQVAVARHSLSAQGFPYSVCVVGAVVGRIDRASESGRARQQTSSMRAQRADAAVPLLLQAPYHVEISQEPPDHGDSAARVGVSVFPNATSPGVGRKSGAQAMVLSV